MDDALFVDEVHAVDDLQHVFDHFPLRQLKVLVNDPLEELTARNPSEPKHHGHEGGVSLQLRTTTNQN